MASVLSIACSLLLQFSPHRVRKFCSMLDPHGTGKDMMRTGEPLMAAKPQVPEGGPIITCRCPPLTASFGECFKPGSFSGQCLWEVTNLP